MFTAAPHANSGRFAKQDNRPPPPLQPRRAQSSWLPPFSSTSTSFPLPTLLDSRHTSPPFDSCPSQPDKLKLIGEYKAKIEKELETICGDILTIIDENLLPNSQSNEPKVSRSVPRGAELSLTELFQHQHPPPDTRRRKYLSASAFRCQLFPRRTFAYPKPRLQRDNPTTQHQRKQA